MSLPEINPLVATVYARHDIPTDASVELALFGVAEKLTSANQIIHGQSRTIEYLQSQVDRLQKEVTSFRARDARLASLFFSRD